ncbi:hypothetical protein [Ferrimonas sediminum]|uniref:hypothetical protein n=1 Tax=Ferrimonas sediminum TaxID=718193 RepID=UPI00115FFF17|nr:hypothetical protein [Ferrimonas sediminum]
MREKLPHPGLQLASISHAYEKDLSLPLPVEGAVGSVTIGFADGEPLDVVALTGTGQLQIENAGHTRLMVTDSGNDHYLGTQAYIDVSIDKAARAPLLVNDLALDYQALAEHQLSVEGGKGSLSYRLAGSDSVVELDPSGLLTVIGVGDAQVEVHDDGGRNYQPATATAEIRVRAGDGAVARFVDLSPKPFVSGGKLHPSFTGPLQPNSRFAIASGADTEVVRVNGSSGDMDILHAGQTQVEVTQYATDGTSPVSVQRFSVTVEPVANGELAAPALTLEYGFDEEFTLPVHGVKGALTFALNSDADGAIIRVVDDTKGIFGFESVGTARVLVSDSGNRDYLPAQIIVTVEVEKRPSDGLTTEPVTRTYVEDLEFSIPVIGATGQLSYGVVDGQDQDVVTVSADGLVRVLRPGSTTLWINDDGDGVYQSQRVTLEVTIDKMVNEALVADDLLLEFDANAPVIPVVRGHHGQLSFVVEGDDVLRQNGDGSIGMVAAGRGWVTVTDSGDEFYLSGSSRFYVDVSFADGTLKVGNVSASYVEGKQLAIPVSGVLGQLSYRYDNAQPEDVVEIDEGNRRLIIRNAGTTLIGITDSGDAGHGARGAMMRVTIDKAPKNTALSLSQTLFAAVFDEGDALEGPSVSGRSTESQLQFLPLDANQQVVTLDYDSGDMVINNAGQADFVVTETSRNFEDTALSYSLRVDKAPYPGLPDADAVFAPAFVPGMRVEPIAVTSPKGKLSYRLAGTPSTDYQLLADGTLLVHRFPQTPPVTIAVIDDGGRNYEPASWVVPVYFDDYQPGQGELGQLTFNGTPLRIDSPVEVASGESSHYSVFQLSRHGATAGDNDDLEGGYTLQVVGACLKDNPSACLNLTLRLQNTAQCGDGSQLARPLAYSQLSGCTPQVSVTFNDADPFNASLPSGHFVSRQPVMLVHYAHPYQPGGVIEAEDLQARAWWLLDVDIIIP